MNCIIIEDQPPAQRILKKYIDDIGSLHLKGAFPDAMKAMAFLKEEPIDLIFLDIHLPTISGIDFLKALPNPPHIILTTAFSDYALEGYELNVVDYLLKPFSFQRFVKAVSKVPPKHHPSAAHASPEADAQVRKEIFIKSGHEYIRLALDNILYIKSDADYTELHTLGHKYLSSESLRYWSAHLNADQYVQIHKSYIVNTGHIEKVSGNQVYLSQEGVLPIGRAYKDAFINNYIK